MAKEGGLWTTAIGHLSGTAERCRHDGHGAKWEVPYEIESALGEGSCLVEEARKGTTNIRLDYTWFGALTFVTNDSCAPLRYYHKTTVAPWHVTVRPR